MEPNRQPEQSREPVKSWRHSGVFWGYEKPVFGWTRMIGAGPCGLVSHRGFRLQPRTERFPLSNMTSMISPTAPEAPAKRVNASALARLSRLPSLDGAADGPPSRRFDPHRDPSEGQAIVRALDRVQQPGAHRGLDRPVAPVHARIASATSNRNTWLLTGFLETKQRGSFPQPKRGGDPGRIFTRQ